MRILKLILLYFVSLIFLSLTILSIYAVINIGVSLKYEVDEAKMLQDIEITKGLLFSGRVLITLVEKEGISREDAYAIAQSNAMRCWNEKIPLLDLLKADSRISRVTHSELESLFDLGYYLKHIDEIFSRFPELTA